MKSIEDIIALWPSHVAFGTDTGIDRGAVQRMIERDTVRSKYHLKIVQAAEKRGYSGVTLLLLATICASPNPKKKKAEVKLSTREPIAA